MRILLTALFTLILSIFFCELPRTISAGNKEMVERRIKELDAINKKIVKKSLRELPENGGIQTKVKIFYKRGDIKLKLIEQTVSPIKEKTIELNSSTKNKWKN